MIAALRHRLHKQLRDGERGAVLVIVALTLTGLLVVAAVVIDIGYAKQERRGAQNSADAAALAAAQELDGTASKLTNAVSMAKGWATKNDDRITAASWQGCKDPSPLPVRPDHNNTCISFSADMRTVRVSLPIVTTPTFFAGVADLDELKVGATAAARKSPAAAAAGPCGLCVIGNRTLQIASNTSIRVTGGEIQADRLTANANDSNNAITPVPLRWFASNGSNWGRNVQPAPVTFNSRYSQLAAAVPNPFASTTVSYTGLTTSGANIHFNGGANPLSPNVIYTQNININGGTLNLAPGTYYFANTLTVASGATLTGNGVTLAFVCTKACPSGEPGKFNFSNGSTVSITAPTSGPYAGFSLLFDPNGTSGTPNQLSGNITLNGAVYGKGVGFNMGSSSGTIRAWTIVAGGNFDANQGTLLIDNTAFSNAMSGGSGSSGSVSLVT